MTDRHPDRRPGRLPDLLAASAAELTQAPVLINGMRVLFDHKTALLPVQLEPAPAPPPPPPEDRRDPA